MSEIKIKDRELFVITEDQTEVTIKSRDRKGLTKISFNEKGKIRNLLSEIWLDQIELKAFVDFLQKQLKPSTMSVEIPQFTLNEEIIKLYDKDMEETENIKDAFYLSRKVYMSLEDCNKIINSSEPFE